MFVVEQVDPGHSTDLLAAVGVLAGAYPMAVSDTLRLGGPLGWRLGVFAVAFGAGGFAARTIVRRHAAAVRTPPFVATVGLGTAAFAATTTALASAALIASR